MATPKSRAVQELERILDDPQSTIEQRLRAALALDRRERLRRQKTLRGATPKTGGQSTNCDRTAAEIARMLDEM